VSGPDLADLIAAVPYFGFLGLRPGPGGTVVLPGELRHQADEGLDVVHGGVLAAFVEAAGRLHLLATGAPAAVAVEVTTDFLRPAALVDTVAHVSEVRRGRSVARLRIQLHQGDPDRPVVAAHGSWVLSEPPPQSG
jgi:uncharacterized protein (TIGR00369 family)